MGARWILNGAEWVCIQPQALCNCTSLTLMQRFFLSLLHSKGESGFAQGNSAYLSSFAGPRVAQSIATKYSPGVPVVAQWKQIQLGTVRLRVQSLESFSGLRTWHCLKLLCKSQMRFGSCVAVAVV